MTLEASDLNLMSAFFLMDLTIGLIMNLPFSVDLDSVYGAVSLITLLRGSEKRRKGQFSQNPFNCLTINKDLIVSC